MKEKWAASFENISTSRLKQFSGNSASLEKFGYHVVAVHPGSHAEHAGIQLGDVLIYIDGQPVMTTDVAISIDKTHRWKRRSLRFLRQSHTGASLFTVKSQAWLPGLVLRPSMTMMSYYLFRSDFDTDDLELFWKSGALMECAQLYSALEALNYRYMELDGAPLMRTEIATPHSNTPLSDDFWFPNWGYLALSAALAGHHERSRYVLDEIYAFIQEYEGGIPCALSSLYYYTESLLSEAQGDIKNAREHVRSAIDSAWEIDENYRRLTRLSDSKYIPRISPYVGMSLSYSLPRIDPAEIVHQEYGLVSLADACQNMGEDQFLLLVALANYRSNSFYSLGWKTTARLLKQSPDIIGGIHIVTSGTYALREDMLRAEDPLLEVGQEFNILYDQNGALDRQLEATRAPINLALNSNAEVVAEGPLFDETLIWKAVKAISKV